MLGSDLLGFHVQYHCNNFLETVDRTVEARTCWERFNVSRGGQTTRVRPYPISVDPNLATEYLGDDWAVRATAIRQKFSLSDRPLIVGVDRVDYTKGIPERIRAVGRMLERYPTWCGEFHFVQIGAPSRTNLPAYQHLNDEVQALADEVNGKYGRDDWQPVVFINEHCGPEDIFALYRTAAGCVVSSLHDGMNLVAKEFVTARADEQGVLVLSEFTGAARELTDAILVNPFDIDRLADGLHTSLTMPTDEQQRRMTRMRAQVADHNIYRWAGMLLSEAGRLVGDTAPATPDNERDGQLLYELEGKPLSQLLPWASTTAYKNPA
jgi:trehalose 6-phosphate synthase